MIRIAPALLFALTACHTTTQATVRKATPSFERELTPETPIAKLASGEVEAVVFDFPRKKLIGLSGKVSSWLGWLDERAPQAAIESVQNFSTEAVAVNVSLHGGPPVPCVLDPKLARSTFPFEALSKEALAAAHEAFSGVPHPARVDGFSISIGQTELSGPSVDVGAKECRLGADFLSRLVVLLPNRGNQPVLILVPRE